MSVPFCWTPAPLVQASMAPGSLLCRAGGPGKYKLSGFLPCPEECFLWVSVAAVFVGTLLPLPSPNSDQLCDQHWLNLVLFPLFCFFLLFVTSRLSKLPSPGSTEPLLPFLHSAALLFNTRSSQGARGDHHEISRLLILSAFVHTSQVCQDLPSHHWNCSVRPILKLCLSTELRSPWGT